MSDVLPRIDSPGVKTVPQINLHHFARLLSRAFPADVKGAGGLVRWLTPLVHPWFRGVLSERPATGGDGNVIDAQISRFNATGVPGFSWWLEPDVRHSGWEALLEERGFTFSSDTPGMVADLYSLPQSPLPPGLTVKPVRDNKTLKLWAAVCGEGFGMGGDPNEGMYKTMRAVGLDLPVRGYLGYLNGEPVATSCLYLGAGVAGVYMVTTLNWARGRGLGAAMTLAPLYDGRDEGYHVGTLQSSAMGFPVYERLGFRTVCQVENYYLSLNP